MDYRRSRYFTRFNFNTALLLVFVSTMLTLPSPGMAQTYSNPIVLHTFNGTDGQYPNAGLTMDSQGNLYGVTDWGGAAFNPAGNPGNYGQGTVYKYSAGTLTTLANFDGPSGTHPQGRVTLDALGNIWGVTYQGGVDYAPLNNHFGYGTIYEISSQGVFAPGVVEFGGPNGDNPIGTLTLDGNGNLVGATYQGGAPWNPALSSLGLGTVFQLAPDLAFTNPSFFNGSDGTLPNSGVIGDSQGNLYGTTYNGGAGGFGVLYEISSSGVVTTLATFNGPNGKLPMGVPVMDSQGNLYGTTYLGGVYGYGTLWKYSPTGGLTTLVHFNGVNGQWPYSGVTIDANGNLLGTTESGGLFTTYGGTDGVLYQYSTTTGVLSTLINFDWTNYGANPYDGVIIDQAGNLYGTANTGGSTGYGTIYELQPISTSLTVSSVSLSPTTVQGGGASQGTVTLSGVAPSGGIVVTLGTNNSAVTAQGPVVVAAGSSSATFTVSTNTVPNNTNVSIVASVGSSSQQATLTVTPPTTITLSSLALDPDLVEGGTSSTGTVTLNAAAPWGGTVVSLSSDSSDASVPSSVTVAHGNISASFTVTTQSVSSTTWATITATLGTDSKQYTLGITPQITITPSTVNLNPTTANVQGGSSAIGTVLLNHQAPSGGEVVQLSSTSLASVPSSVTVPEGVTAADFNISTYSVTSTSSATITATLNGGSAQTTLTLTPASSVVLSSIVLNPTSVAGGTTSQATVTLTGPAPTGGALVLLSSNNSFALVPTAVSVPWGMTTASFAVSTAMVTSNSTAVITATLGGNSQQATLTINSGTSLTVSSLTLNPTTVTGGNSSTGTVTLSAAAPSGGTVVSLSSNSGYASVPSSVTVAAGNTSASFTVTTQTVTSNTSAIITATVGTSSQQATLTINAGTSLTVSSLTLNPTTVTGGNSSTGTVTLSAAAPSGGTVVSLSSNSGYASVPSSVTVAAGNTSASFTVTTQTVTSNTSAIITATVGTSSQQATLTITPATVTLSSLTLNPTSVRGGNSSQGTVTLSGAAPSGGAVVSLSSSNTSVATVPSSVTVSAGNTSATFTVSTKRVYSNKTVTISAIYSGVTKTATLTVTSR